jgi:hypothetical protein
MKGRRKDEREEEEEGRGEGREEEGEEKGVKGGRESRKMRVEGEGVGGVVCKGGRINDRGRRVRNMGKERGKGSVSE